ncbi:MAG: 16S rRNA (cytosine(1402)-N(4))-methyltransferase, partial [Gammaproteobacteria bacterium]
TRTFQAIRIYINNELDEVRDGLHQAFDVLRVNGRLLAISFHSLEDRIVKRFMREYSQCDPYPKDIPVTADMIKPKLKVIGKAVRAGAEEVAANPRSRSAVLRIGEKLAA